MHYISASERLRESTNQAHRSLDAHPILKSLVRPSLSEQEYTLALLALEYWIRKHYLNVSHCFNAPFKQRLLERYSWLLDDLKALKATDHILDIKPTGVQSLSQEEALGAIYVFEGASLGGRVLAPLVNKSLSREDITAFYTGYGDKTYELWKETQLELNSKLTDSNQIDIAIQTAKQMFANMAESLDFVSDYFVQQDEVSNA